MVDLVHCFNFAPRAFGGADVSGLGGDVSDEEPTINRQCPECGGYELDDGTCDICYCDVWECENGCGEGVLFGGFCSMKCKIEWEFEHGRPTTDDGD